MQIGELKPNDAQLERLIALSEDWAAENITYGYGPNTRESILSCRIFAAEEKGEILGYLLGQEQRVEQPCAVMPQGVRCFEIEDLYVAPAHRNKGIGRALYDFAEQQAKKEGCGYIRLSTATKDYQRILHFYIDELGMKFWTAVLFKQL